MCVETRFPGLLVLLIYESPQPIDLSCWMFSLLTKSRDVVHDLCRARSIVFVSDFLRTSVVRQVRQHGLYNFPYPYSPPDVHYCPTVMMLPLKRVQMVFHATVHR